MTFMTPMGFFGIGRSQTAAITLNGTDERLDRIDAGNSSSRKNVFSLWVRPFVSGTTRPILSVAPGATNLSVLYLGSDNLLRFDHTVAASPGETINAQSAATIPDSVWTHLFVQYDSTLGTASDRIKMWINGVSTAVSYSGSNTPDLNQVTWMGINARTHSIGFQQSGGPYFSGDLAQFHWILDSIYPVTDFGVSDDGLWQAKIPTGVTYGLFTMGGFYDFSNSAALGTDASGSGHNFTPANIDASNSIGDGPPLYVAP